MWWGWGMDNNDIHGIQNFLWYFKNLMWLLEERGVWFYSHFATVFCRWELHFVAMEEHPHFLFPSFDMKLCVNQKEVLPLLLVSKKFESSKLRKGGEFLKSFLSRLLSRSFLRSTQTNFNLPMQVKKAKL